MKSDGIKQYLHERNNLINEVFKMAKKRMSQLTKTNSLYKQVIFELLVQGLVKVNNKTVFHHLGSLPFCCHGVLNWLSFRDSYLAAPGVDSPLLVISETVFGNII